MSRRLIAAAATAALALGLAACGEGGDGPQIEPPPEVDVGQGASDGGSDEASPSDEGGEPGADDGSTEAAPDIPAPDPADFPGMDENTAEGAEQALKYYWAGAFWGMQTGDPKVIAGMQGEACGGCIEWVEKVSVVNENGLYWSLAKPDDQLVEGNIDDSKVAVVSYLFLLPLHSEADGDAERLIEVPEQVYSSVGKLVWDGTKWKIDEVVTVVEPSVGD